ncbi:hypothetical protein CYMTET_28405, partial [Cymbomonas tetramitiformis]
LSQTSSVIVLGSNFESIPASIFEHISESILGSIFASISASTFKSIIEIICGTIFGSAPASIFKSILERILGSIFGSISASIFGSISARISWSSLESAACKHPIRIAKQHALQQRKACCGRVVAWAQVHVQLSQLVLYGMQLGLGKETVVMAAALNMGEVPFIKATKFSKKSVFSLSQDLLRGIGGQEEFDQGLHSMPIAILRVLAWWRQRRRTKADCTNRGLMLNQVRQVDDEARRMEERLGSALIDPHAPLADALSPRVARLLRLALVWSAQEEGLLKMVVKSPSRRRARHVDLMLHCTGPPASRAQLDSVIHGPYEARGDWVSVEALVHFPRDHPERLLLEGMVDYLDTPRLASIGVRLLISVPHRSVELSVREPGDEADLEWLGAIWRVLEEAAPETRRTRAAEGPGGAHVATTHLLLRTVQSAQKVAAKLRRLDPHHEVATATLAVSRSPAAEGRSSGRQAGGGVEQQEGEAVREEYVVTLQVNGRAQVEEADLAAHFPGCSLVDLDRNLATRRRRDCLSSTSSEDRLQMIRFYVEPPRSSPAEAGAARVGGGGPIENAPLGARLLLHLAKVCRTGGVRLPSEDGQEEDTVVTEVVSPPGLDRKWTFAGRRKRPGRPGVARVEAYLTVNSLAYATVDVDPARFMTDTKEGSCAELYGIASTQMSVGKGHKTCLAHHVSLLPAGPGWVALALACVGVPQLAGLPAVTGPHTRDLIERIRCILGSSDAAATGFTSALRGRLLQGEGGTCSHQAPSTSDMTHTPAVLLALLDELFEGAADGRSEHGATTQAVDVAGNRDIGQEHCALTSEQRHAAETAINRTHSGSTSAHTVERAGQLGDAAQEGGGEQGGREERGRGAQAAGAVSTPAPATGAEARDAGDGMGARWASPGAGAAPQPPGEVYPRRLTPQQHAVSLEALDWWELRLAEFLFYNSLACEAELKEFRLKCFREWERTRGGPVIRSLDTRLRTCMNARGHLFVDVTSHLDATTRQFGPLYAVTEPLRRALQQRSSPVAASQQGAAPPSAEGAASAPSYAEPESEVVMDVYEAAVVGLFADRESIHHQELRIFQHQWRHFAHRPLCNSSAETPAEFVRARPHMFAQPPGSHRIHLAGSVREQATRESAQRGAPTCAIPRDVSVVPCEDASRRSDFGNTDEPSALPAPALDAHEAGGPSGNSSVGSFADEENVDLLEVRCESRDQSEAPAALASTSAHTVERAGQLGDAAQEGGGEQGGREERGRGAQGAGAVSTPAPATGAEARDAGDGMGARWAPPGAGAAPQPPGEVYPRRLTPQQHAVSLEALDWWELRLAEFLFYNSLACEAELKEFRLKCFREWERTRGGPVIRSLDTRLRTCMNARGHLFVDVTSHLDATTRQYGPLYAVTEPLRRALQQRSSPVAASQQRAAPPSAEGAASAPSYAEPESEVVMDVYEAAVVGLFADRESIHHQELRIFQHQWRHFAHRPLCNSSAETPAEFVRARPHMFAQPPGSHRIHLAGSVREQATRESAQRGAPTCAIPRDVSVVPCEDASRRSDFGNTDEPSALPAPALDAHEAGGPSGNSSVGSFADEENVDLLEVRCESRDQSEAPAALASTSAHTVERAGQLGDAAQEGGGEERGNGGASDAAGRGWAQGAGAVSTPASATGAEARDAGDGMGARWAPPGAGAAPQPPGEVYPRRLTPQQHAVSLEALDWWELRLAEFLFYNSLACEAELKEFRLKCFREWERTRGGPVIRSLDTRLRTCMNARGHLFVDVTSHLDATTRQYGPLYAVTEPLRRALQQRSSPVAASQQGAAPPSAEGAASAPSYAEPESEVVMDVYEAAVVGLFADRESIHHQELRIFQHQWRHFAHRPLCNSSAETPAEFVRARPHMFAQPPGSHRIHLAGSVREQATRESAQRGAPTCAIPRDVSVVPCEDASRRSDFGNTDEPSALPAPALDTHEAGGPSGNSSVGSFADEENVNLLEVRCESRDQSEAPAALASTSAHTVERAGQLGNAAQEGGGEERGNGGASDAAGRGWAQGAGAVSTPASATAPQPPGEVYPRRLTPQQHAVSLEALDWWELRLAEFLFYNSLACEAELKEFRLKCFREWERTRGGPVIRSLDTRLRTCMNARGHLFVDVTSHLDATTRQYGPLYAVTEPLRRALQQRSSPVAASQQGAAPPSAEGAASAPSYAEPESEVVMDVYEAAVVGLFADRESIHHQELRIFQHQWRHFAHRPLCNSSAETPAEFVRARPHMFAQPPGSHRIHLAGSVREAMQ